MRKNMKMRWKRIFALFLAVMLLFTSSGIESVGMAVYAAEEAASAVTEAPAEGDTTEPKEPTEPEAPTDPEQPTDPEIRITVRTAGEHIAFSLDAEDGSYASGSEVRVLAAAEEGYILLPEDIGAEDADGNGIGLQAEVQEDGEILITFTAGEKDVEISAAARKLRTAQVVTQDMEGNATDKLSAQISPQALYEGAEVSVAVHYSGEQIWSAAVSDAEGNEIASVTDGETVTFTMPDSDITVFLAELENRNQGDLSAEDSEITGDWQGNTSNTAKENEPDIELGKSARWTDIEDGYAELTITEKDTSDYSNIPVDYIIVMDRTRTMALNDFNFDGNGSGGWNGENSPCINPNHIYKYRQSNGQWINLYLKDYHTGLIIGSGEWKYNLRPDANLWNSHYDVPSGKRIQPTYENGCYDRLSMAKQAVKELVDEVAEQNASVPADAMKSRVSFWSFAGDNGSSKDGKGLYNYVPLTTDYDSVKQAVDGVKPFSGTYYYNSFEEMYDILTTRNATDSDRKNLYSKVIFISDGVANEDVPESQAMARQIRGLPNTEIFTLAIGMTSDSEGAKLLQSLATSPNHTASFWQNLSFDGGKGGVLAETLFNIDKKAIEIKATNKVLTDKIETKYWEPVEVLSADGGKASLDKNTGVLTWNVPEGAGQTYSCTIKLKLKDEYRYLLSDTSYPTNKDEEGVTAEDLLENPEKAGAVMEHTISGGMYHNQIRKTGVATPELKYGTVNFSGKKNWTVSGSTAGKITVKLMRTLPGAETEVQVNNTVTNASKKWAYAFDERVLPDGSTKPLIKYDEKGRAVTYRIIEDVPEYYTQLGSTEDKGEADENGGTTVETQLFNEPFKVKAELTKVDAETENPLSGAEFSVYMWSKRAGKYTPYTGRTVSDTKPHETGSMDGGEPMKLEEDRKGHYITPSWLYYSPDNEGKFRIIETRAPEGYFGDWKNPGEVTEESGTKDKNVYDLAISPDAQQNGTVIRIANHEDGTFHDTRVLGKLSFSKNDQDTQRPEAQGDATLIGAEYGLYAGEDIVHQDQTTGVLYEKDEKIPVRLTGSENGRNSYTHDVEGTDVLTIGSANFIEVEDLEIGRYYLKETKASEGYLVNPEKFYFDITYDGEKKAVVETEDYKVYEQVKKQSLSFYKVTGEDTSDQLDPLKGAKFTVWLVSSLADGKYKEMTDAEVVQAIIDEYRNPSTLGYEDFKEQNKDAHMEAEIESDDKGIVTTPPLPYGRYVVVETKTPSGVTATRPFIINVTADDEDGNVEGDGLGTPLDDMVILLDKPVMSLVRLKKQDANSNATVLKPGAAYVIHDTDGAWFEYYTKDMTSEKKAEYKEKFGDLVVQYSQGEYLGTPEHPFTTKRISSAEETENVYIDTPAKLPSGTYELQELAAPDGYVLQGHEGVIAKKQPLFKKAAGNGTFYETEETGKWKPTPQGRTKFVISSSEAVYDELARSFVTVVKQKNTPAVGKIAVYAEGEQLVGARQEGKTLLDRIADGFFGFFGKIAGLIGLDAPDENGMTEAELAKYKDYVFEYEQKPVEGAVFEIRAAEDIYSPEGGANAVKIFDAGELVVTLTTDENGQAWTGQEDWEGTDVAKGLPLGKYTVTETKAGEGLALSEENSRPREIEISYAGQEVPVIYRDTAYENPRQKVHIEVTKKDAENDTLLSGAVFGLYTKEDIKNYKGKTVVKAGTLVATAETAVKDEEVQNAVFAPDLPLGQYYIRELSAPYGYTTSKDKVDVDASYRSDQREVIEISETVKNIPTRVQINLMDYYTEEELDGATLTVIDSEGNPFKTMISVHDGNEVIYGLEINETYTVKELVTPEGYFSDLLIKDGYATDKENAVELEKTPADGMRDAVSFTVLDDGKLQVVSVFNKPVTGEVTVKKTGEVAVGSRPGTDENGKPLETPVYEIKGLPGAEYVLRVKETIPYPDSYSGNVFGTGDVVLDRYQELKEETIFDAYEIEVVGGVGELVDVSEFIGVKPEADATPEELKEFYKTHGADVERQIPSAEEIEGGGADFLGTPVKYVLRTDENGLVKLGGLPIGNYEVIEVKAPKGYYRDKTECIEEFAFALPENEKPDSLIKAEVVYHNERQAVQEPEKPVEPLPTEIVYHPDITITKKADKAVYDPGEKVVYRIVVTNTGDVDLKDVYVTDSLAGGEIRRIETLAVNESYAFDYEYTIQEDSEAGSRIDNVVYTTGIPDIPDPGTDENGNPIIIDPSSFVEPEDSDQEKVFVHGADIVVKKTAQQRIYHPGETARYDIEIVNPNAYALIDVTVEDSIDGRFKPVTEDDNIIYNADDTVTLRKLPAGGSVHLVYEYEIPEDMKPGQIENIVVAEGTPDLPEDPDPVTGEDKEIVIVRNPEITITKTADKKVYDPGETVLYTIRVTNTGDCRLTDVEVEEQLLAGVFTETSKGTIEENKVLIGSMDAGETVTLLFEYAIPEDAGAGSRIDNIVSVHGKTEPTPDPAIPQLPDGTPNYLPDETVSDNDPEEVYTDIDAGLAVTKYSVDEGVRKLQKGAEFTLYAKEDIRNIFGELIYAAGTEIETAVSGDNGTARFLTDVPIGVYLVKETKAPAGHYGSAKEIIFRVDESAFDDSVHYVKFTDFVENAVTAVSIKLIDDMTGNELAEASLKITDKSGNPIKAWVTKTEDGCVIKGLNPDEEYTITEVLPRDGYLKEFTGVTVNSENAEVSDPKGAEVSFIIRDVPSGITEDGKIDKETIPDMTKIILENRFVTGRVRINKDGELLESWTLLDKAAAFVKSLFTYGKQPLEGVEFTVYAKEDIIHPDGITGIVLHKGDTALVRVRGLSEKAVAVTDKLGVAVFEGMYLGKYEVAETKTIEGFNRDAEPREFTLAYADGSTSSAEALEGDISWTNERQKVRISVLKTDEETGEALSGAVFGLYAKEDIQNYKGETIVPADSLLEIVETDREGKAVFESDLPQAVYYVKELSAPEGYVISDGQAETVEVLYDPDVEIVEKSVSFTNIPNDVQLNVEKSTIALTQEDEVYHYRIDAVRNEGNCIVNDFTLTDELPKEVTLQYLHTGTFEGLKDSDTYTIWYQTNRSAEYRIWKEVPASVNMKLHVADLGLKEGEKVTAFEYRFGTVLKGFSEKTVPVYAVKVDRGLSEDDVLVNTIRLSGEKLGITYTDEDRTETKLYYPPDLTPEEPSVPGNPDDPDNPGNPDGGGEDPSVPGTGSGVPGTPPATGDRSFHALWLGVAGAAVLLAAASRKKVKK